MSNAAAAAEKQAEWMIGANDQRRRRRRQHNGNCRWHLTISHFQKRHTHTKSHLYRWYQTRDGDKTTEMNIKCLVLIETNNSFRRYEHPYTIIVSFLCESLLSSEYILHDIILYYVCKLEFVRVLNERLKNKRRHAMWTKQCFQKYFNAVVFSCYRIVNKIQASANIAREKKRGLGESYIFFYYVKRDKKRKIKEKTTKQKSSLRVK